MVDKVYSVIDKTTVDRDDKGTRRLTAIATVDEKTEEIITFQRHHIFHSCRFFTFLFNVLLWFDRVHRKNRSFAFIRSKQSIVYRGRIVVASRCHR